MPNEVWVQFRVYSILSCYVFFLFFEFSSLSCQETLTFKFTITILKYYLIQWVYRRSGCPTIRESTSSAVRAVNKTIFDLHLAIRSRD